MTTFVLQNELVRFEFAFDKFRLTFLGYDSGCPTGCIFGLEAPSLITIYGSGGNFQWPLQAKQWSLDPSTSGDEPLETVLPGVGPVTVRRLVSQVEGVGGSTAQLRLEMALSTSADLDSDVMNGGVACWRATLENCSHDVQIDEIVMMDGALLIAEDKYGMIDDERAFKRSVQGRFVHLSGFQSWSFSGSLKCGSRQPKPQVPAKFARNFHNYSTSSRRLYYESDGYAMVSEADVDLIRRRTHVDASGTIDAGNGPRSGLVIGFLSQHETFGKVFLDSRGGEKHARLVAECDGVLLRAGDRLRTDWAGMMLMGTQDARTVPVVLNKPPPPEHEVNTSYYGSPPPPKKTQLDEVRRCRILSCDDFLEFAIAHTLAKVNHQKRQWDDDNHGLTNAPPFDADRPPIGWCSWYQYFENIDEASLFANLKNLAGAEKCKEPYVPPERAGGGGDVESAAGGGEENNPQQPEDAGIPKPNQVPKPNETAASSLKQSSFDNRGDDGGGGDQAAATSDRGLRDEVPLNVFLVDDGYMSENVWDDWTRDACSERFPSGLARLAEEISSRDLIPGLWMAPFSVDFKSTVYESKPDWVLYDSSPYALFKSPTACAPFLRRPSQRRPVNSGYPNKFFACLDATNPEVLDFVSEAIAVAKSRGFRLLKLDFLYSCVENSLFARCPNSKNNRFDPTTTRAQAFQRALRAVRKAAGEDVYLIGCGCPQMPGFGWFDQMRVGTDSGPTYKPPYLFWDRTNIPSVRNSVSGALIRSSHVDAYSNIDPDCLLLRPSTGTDSKLSLKEIIGYVTVVAILGGSTMFSDDVSVLPDDRLGLLRVATPATRRPFEIRDKAQRMIPELGVVRFDFGSEPKRKRAVPEYDSAALFNWEGGANKIKSINRGEIGLATDVEHDVFEFWTSTYTRLSSGRNPFVQPSSTPPRSASLYHFRRHANLDTCAYIGSNLHFSCGYEVADWKDYSAFGRKTLEFTLRLPRRTVGFVWLRVPGNAKPKARETSMSKHKSFKATHYASEAGEEGSDQARDVTVGWVHAGQVASTINPANTKPYSVWKLPVSLANRYKKRAGWFQTVVTVEW